MFKRMLEAGNTVLKKSAAEQQGVILEQLLIAKYGTYEKAQAAMEKVKENCADENEFNLALNKELHVEAFEKIGTKLSKITSITKLIEFIALTDAGKFSFEMTEKEIADMTVMNESLQHLLPGILGMNGLIAESVFLNEFSQKIRFTFKEIREQIPVSQKTFTKWLHHFYGTKYDGARDMSLLEYIDIYKQLLLKEQEEKFDFTFDSEEYLKRISEGLVFSKQRLMQLTDSDYKTLQANCENLKLNNESLTLNYKNSDIFPYRIAHIILDKMGE